MSYGYGFGETITPERRAAEQRERLARALEALAQATMEATSQLSRIAHAQEENATLTRLVWQELVNANDKKGGRK